MPDISEEPTHLWQVISVLAFSRAEKREFFQYLLHRNVDLSSLSKEEYIAYSKDYMIYKIRNLSPILSIAEDTVIKMRFSLENLSNLATNIVYFVSQGREMAQRIASLQVCEKIIQCVNTNSTCSMSHALHLKKIWQQCPGDAIKEQYSQIVMKAMQNCVDNSDQVTRGMALNGTVILFVQRIAYYTKERGSWEEKKIIVDPNAYPQLLRLFDRLAPREMVESLAHAIQDIFMSNLRDSRAFTSENDCYLMRFIKGFLSV